RPYRRAAERRGPARARAWQWAASCRPDDLSLQGQPPEPLPDRPRGAADRELHRDRRDQRAGPCDPGKHGTDCRPEQTASRPRRQGHHPDAPPPAPGGQDRRGGRQPGRADAELLQLERGTRSAAARGRLAASPCTRYYSGKDPADSLTPVTGIKIKVAAYK